jgi:hypothetical protein
MESPLKIEKALPRSKGKTEEQESAGEPETTTAPVNNTNNRRNKGNKQRARRQPGTTTQQPGSIQPDPRWADELAKLKEMFAAQASNP